jgi:hypothetical protein
VARTVQVTGVGGVPAGADAVVLNVTVTATTAASYLTIWPAGAAQPLASSLNWPAGATIPNAVTVKVGANGSIGVYNSAGSVDVIADVVGYYTAGVGKMFHPIVPVRLQDSRPSGPQYGPYGTPWTAGMVRPVQVAGLSGVPEGVDAVVLNVTATGTSANAYMTLWPAGATQPVASSLNWSPNQTIPNAVTVKVGTAGNVNIFNSAGTLDVIADAVGYFT